MPQEPDAAALRAQIEAAPSLDGLAAAAAGIPQLAGAAIGEAARSDQVAQVAAITALISELNDRVTARVVQQIAAEEGVDLARGCWLTFGSEARREQTLATDQDNGLVFAPLGDAAAERPSWMAFGQRVNDALARCGYPLCTGNVMAGQAPCCMTQDEWSRCFEHWMAHGGRHDLMAARIYFDLRPLAGNLELARPLTELLASPAAAVPRFLKQMADIVLCNHVPLNWFGGIRTTQRHGRAMFNLKMNGTALFTDAARLWALAYGVADTGTAPRLSAAALAMRVPARESEAWQQGFQTLQGLRLAMQRHLSPDADPEERTWVDWTQFTDEQRRALKQALRAARWVQQRIELDYDR